MQEYDRRAPQPRPPRGLHRRLWIWLVYLLLFALSVPWYLPADGAPALWLGLPYWVVLSLLAVVAIAGFTAWVLGLALNLALAWLVSMGLGPRTRASN